MKNLFDRIVEAYDPVRALQRAKARAGLSAFDALSTTTTDDSTAYGGQGQTLSWWRPGRRDAAGDTLRVLGTQRGQVRELARTNPIAGGAINTNCDRVVGTGLALVPTPNLEVLGWTPEQGQEFKTLVQNEFSMWADSAECDQAGEQNFYDKQELTLRSALESGDCFTLMPDGPSSRLLPYRLRLQTLEADRVGNPNNSADSISVAGGVRRVAGANGAEAYFVYDVHPGTVFIGVRDRYAGQWYKRVGASGRRRILHHFQQLRPEQPRGIPYLAPVIESLKQLGRYSEAEIQAAVVSAFFTMVIETETGKSPAPIFGASDPTPGGGAAPTGDNEIQMGPGAVLGLAKGEKATFADPSRPNTAFDPFVQAILRQIGIGLGIPYELLVKQFNASYSASKAALLDAWMWFRRKRTWLARSFCQPVYETWFAEGVANGRIPAPGFFQDPLLRWAYTRAEWQGDSMGSINPKDEVEAYKTAIDERLMTRERAEWELFGSDWYQTFSSKKTEQAMLKSADLLPVPKAGAAAPKDTQPDPSQTAIAAAVTAIAAREPTPSNVTVNNAAPQVNVEPPRVEIHQGDMTVNLPESQIQLEAHIEQPDVTVQPANVHVDVPAPVVHVRHAHATRQTINRDASGEIASVVTEPISPTED